LSQWVKQLRGPTTGTSEPRAFVEVPSLASEPAPRLATRDCVTLRLAERLALEIPVGADAAWVAQLVKTLN